MTSVWRASNLNDNTHQIIYHWVDFAILIMMRPWLLKIQRRWLAARLMAVMGNWLKTSQQYWQHQKHPGANQWGMINKIILGSLDTSWTKFLISIDYYTARDSMMFHWKDIQVRQGVTNRAMIKAAFKSEMVGNWPEKVSGGSLTKALLFACLGYCLNFSCRFRLDSIIQLKSWLVSLNVPALLIADNFLLDAHADPELTQPNCFYSEYGQRQPVRGISQWHQSADHFLCLETIQ